MGRKKNGGQASIEGKALRILFGKVLKKQAEKEEMSVTRFIKEKAQPLSHFIHPASADRKIRAASFTTLKTALPFLHDSWVVMGPTGLGFNREGHNFLLEFIGEVGLPTLLEVKNAKKEKRQRTAVVRQQMPMEVLVDIMYLSRNPNLSARMLRVAEYLEGNNQKLSTLLRQASDQSV